MVDSGFIAVNKEVNNMIMAISYLCCEFMVNKFYSDNYCDYQWLITIVATIKMFNARESKING